MKDHGSPIGMARLSTWFSREHWTERIITFNASWFVASMGTGVMVQVLTNVPYQAQWLRDVAFCFWMLVMILFLFFSTLGIIRLIRYPHLARGIFEDFFQTSFLGAIPVTLDTIISGLIIFYPEHPAAVWAAFGLFWVSVTMTLAVGGIVVFITCAYQEAPELTSVTGVWLLSFIPCIVTSSTGANVLPHLQRELQGFTLIVSFLLWSIGTVMCMIITSIYFWRLIRHKLPVRDAIVSCFIPMGPPGLGAYSVQTMSVVLSNYITTQDFSPLPHTLPSDAAARSTATAAVATSIRWMGVFASLLLVAVSTFWLLQSVLSIAARVPKRFNVGFWSFVFPNGVYANALCLLATNLDNHGLRGWAAAMAAVTALLWCFCAACTVYKGVWCGELFFPPGLEGWNERRALGLESSDSAETSGRSLGSPGSRGKKRTESSGEQSNASSSDAVKTVPEDGGLARVMSDGDAEVAGGEYQITTQRESRPDGTYAFSKLRKKKKRTRS